MTTNQDELVSVLKTLPQSSTSDEDLLENIASIETFFASDLPDAILLPTDQGAKKEKETSTLSTVYAFQIASTFIGSVLRIPISQEICNFHSDIPKLIGEMEKSLEKVRTREEFCTVCDEICGKANQSLSVIAGLWETFIEKACKKATTILPEQFQKSANVVLDWMKPSKQKIPTDFLNHNFTEITEQTIQETLDKFKTQLETAVDKQVSNFMMICLVDSLQNSVMLSAKLFKYYNSIPDKILSIKRDFAKIREYLVEAADLVKKCKNNPTSSKMKITSLLGKADVLIHTIDRKINKETEELEEDKQKATVYFLNSVFNVAAIGKVLYDTYDTIKHPTRVWSYVTGGLNIVNSIGSGWVYYNSKKLLEEFYQLKLKNEEYKLAHDRIQQLFDAMCKKQERGEEESIRKIMDDNNLSEEQARSIFETVKKLM